MQYVNIRLLKLILKNVANTACSLTTTRLRTYRRCCVLIW